MGSEETVLPSEESVSEEEQKFRMSLLPSMRAIYDADRRELKLEKPGGPFIDALLVMDAIG